MNKLLIILLSFVGACISPTAPKNVLSPPDSTYVHYPSDTIIVTHQPFPPIH